MAAAEPTNRVPGDGNLPVPDPTVLTQQAVDRSLSAYRKEMDVVLAGIDRDISAQREYLLGEIRRVKDVHDERFTGIGTQFTERDERTKQAAQDSKVSLDAGLAGQKEAAFEAQKSSALAIGKSEDATKEALSSQAATTSISIRALEKELGELRSRLDRLPGEQAATSKTERRLDLGQIILAAAVLIAALGLILAHL
jgi:hypothetical protein